MFLTENKILLNTRSKTESMICKAEHNDPIYVVTIITKKRA